ncbi:MAG: two-component system chemotaxis response regulator CheB [Sulfurimonas sp.]
MKNSIPRKIVLIGASTGGPGQIEKILGALEKLEDTSIIIAQHMSEGFMPSFAKRLQEHYINDISIAQNGNLLEVGKIYVCCGKTMVSKSASGLTFSQEKSTEHAFNPDINIVFKSFLAFTKDTEILSVILTGIGSDGVEACKMLSEKACVCITESEESAIVDGMPCRARKEVQNIKVQDINDIVKSIKEFCS